MVHCKLARKAGKNSGQIWKNSPNSYGEKPSQAVTARLRFVSSFYLA
jgi:hypothetical protein